MAAGRSDEARGGGPDGTTKSGFAQSGMALSGVGGETPRTQPLMRAKSSSVQEGVLPFPAAGFAARLKSHLEPSCGSSGGGPLFPSVGCDMALYAQMGVGIPIILRRLFAMMRDRFMITHNA
jgi:hypothetical protein